MMAHLAPPVPSPRPVSQAQTFLGITLLALGAASAIALTSWWIRDDDRRLAGDQALVLARTLAGSAEVGAALRQSPGVPSGELSARLLGALERDREVACVLVLRGATRELCHCRSDEIGDALSAREAQLREVPPGTPTLLHHPPFSTMVSAVDLPGGGRVVVGRSLARADHSRRRLIGILATLAATAVALYALVASALTRRLGGRLRRLALRADQIRGGELSSRIDDEEVDELGEAARALDAAHGRLAALIARLSSLAREVTAAVPRLTRAAETVRQSAGLQRREIGASTEVADELTRFFADLAERTDQLQSTARTGAAVTARAALHADGASRAVAEVETAVEGASNHVTAIARSIAEVGGRAEEVAGVAASTSSALQELTTASHRVRETADTAAQLAQQSIADLERGQHALGELGVGIERIREASGAIREVTSGLEGRVKEIGMVLRLVGDLTERTNLLALNASIIAAQAGVEGRGFAVVAGEIKSLAHRTAASAGEIGALVQRVSEDAVQARQAAEVGAVAVEQGGERARATAATVNEIFRRVRAGAELSRAIATSTDEQLRASRYVADAMEQVTASIDQIARATADQGRQGEQLAVTAARLRELARQVGAATREQREGGRQVTATIDAIHLVVEQLLGQQRQRSSEAARVRATLAALGTVAKEHEAAIGAFEDALGAIEGHARALAVETDQVHE